MPSHLVCVGAAQKSHGHPGAQLQFLMYSALNRHSVAILEPAVRIYVAQHYNEINRTDNAIIDELHLVVMDRLTCCRS